MTTKCIDCNRNYKTICDDNRCYYCYIIKHNKVPDTGLYKIEKKK